MKNQIIANDTKVGPTSPGVWAVYIPKHGEIGYLLCTEVPGTREDCHEQGDPDKQNDLVWIWDNYDETDTPDTSWTKGWHCAPVSCMPPEEVSDWALERMVP